MNKNNIIDLESAINIRDANESLEEIVEFMDEVVQRQSQAQLKADFDIERKHAAALNPEITLGDLDKDQFDSKDIYLETFIGPGKIRQIVGLHAIGYAGQYQYEHIALDQSRTTISTDFESIEVWGNEYDAENSVQQMIGRGSFRIHNPDIDNEAKQWETEGWKRIPNPWKSNARKT